MPDVCDMTGGLGMDGRKCEACRFYVPCVAGGDAANDDTLAAGAAPTSGECRVRAPLRILADAPDALKACAQDPAGRYHEGGEWEQTRRVFPLVYSWDWCGEWKAKDAGD